MRNFSAKFELERALEAGVFSKEQEEEFKEKIKSLYLGGDLTEEDCRALLKKILPPASFQLREGLERYKKNELLKRRWNVIKPNSFISKGTSYRYSHESILERAKHFPPRKVGNSVTDFSGWIFSLYQMQPSQLALDTGRAGERERQRIYQENLNLKKKLNPFRPIESQWSLEYHDALDGTTPSLEISKLSVNGSSIFGRPDYVFKNQVTGEILIVDIKFTDFLIPSDGWPNLRAQLWAYSQIDQYREAPLIYLVGEIWSPPSNYQQSILWVSTDELLHSQNSELFELYKNS